MMRIQDEVERRGLRCPAALVEVYENAPEALRRLLHVPGRASDADVIGIQDAVDLCSRSVWPLPSRLLPILPVDDRSYACVVLSDASGGLHPGEGAVVRWHLDVESPDHQAVLLDTDVAQYARSVAAELVARPIGLHRMLEEIGPAYESAYLGAGRRPRDFVIRPVRLASQNVIIALGAFSYDSVIDAMTVVAWQTCEVAHVNAQEGTRALLALMLCDAFQSGGTMQIAFDRPARVTRMDGADAAYDGHPEGGVPASIQRFARTRGLSVGRERPGSLTPGESRELFLAVTPMPDSLRARVDRAVHEAVASPERLCFTLMAQIWREIELDFLLATSFEAGSILLGGAPWGDRLARQSESISSRRAVMLGMFFRRLVATDAAAATEGVRALEDARKRVRWEIIEPAAAVAFTGVDAGPLPWSAGVMHPGDRDLIVLPRIELDAAVVATARDLLRRGSVAVLVPRGTRVPDGLAADIIVLECPDREPEIDAAIEKTLLTSRTARR